MEFVVTKTEAAFLQRRIQSVLKQVGINLNWGALRRLENEKTETQHSEVFDDDLNNRDFYALISRRSIRIFFVTYGASNLLVNIILGTLRRKRPWIILRGLASRSHLGLAAFISTYAAVYRLLLRYLNTLIPSLILPYLPRGRADTFTYEDGSVRRSAWSTYRPRLRRLFLKTLLSPYVPSFLAGSLASITMLLDPNTDRRVSVALSALTSGARYLYHSIRLAGYVPEAMVQGRWWWGSHLLWALSNAQLLHSFTFYPETFPKSYGNTIKAHSHVYLPQKPSTLPTHAPWPTPDDVVGALAAAGTFKYPKFQSPLLRPGGASSKSTPEGFPTAIVPILDHLAHPGHSQLTCAFIHPHTPHCWKAFFESFWSSFPRYVKFFGTISAVMAATKWKRFLHDPETVVYRYVSNILISGFVASAAASGGWASFCASQSLLPNNMIPTKRIFLQGFGASLVAIAWGYHGRSTDMGLYTVRMALETMWRTLVKRGKVKNIKNGEILLFALGIGTISSLYQVNPNAIQSGLIKRILEKWIGPSEHAPIPRLSLRRGSSVSQDGTTRPRRFT